MEDMITINGIKYIKEDSVQINRSILEENLNNNNLDINDVTYTLEKYLERKNHDGAWIEPKDAANKTTEAKELMLYGFLAHVFN